MEWMETGGDYLDSRYVSIHQKPKI
jgi:hypothetical protein